MIVVTESTLDAPGSVTTVFRDRQVVGTIANHAWFPDLVPQVHFSHAGPDRLNTALLLPTDDDGESPLPVLLDPYGGPHALRVQKARGQFLVSQWFADQGFAVIVSDGRGTPARGPEWERAVRGELHHAHAGG